MERSRERRSRLSLEAMEARIVLTGAPLTEIAVAAPAAIVQTAFEGDGSAPEQLRAVSPDFNDDGLVNAEDIDMLSAAIRSEQHDGNYDLNDDELVTKGDMDFMIYVELETVYGDADLDQAVDGADGKIWRTSAFSTGGWSQGDFNGDQYVDGYDFLIWNAAKRFQPQVQVAPTPGQSSTVEAAESTDDVADASSTSDTPQQPMGIQQSAFAVESVHSDDSDDTDRSQGSDLQAIDSVFSALD